MSRAIFSVLLGLGFFGAALVLMYFAEKLPALPDPPTWFKVVLLGSVALVVAYRIGNGIIECLAPSKSKQAP